MAPLYMTFIFDRHIIDDMLVFMCIFMNECEKNLELLILFKKIRKKYFDETMYLHTHLLNNIFL